MAVKERTKPPYVKIGFLSAICIMLLGVFIFLGLRVFAPHIFSGSLSDRFAVEDLDPTAKMGTPPGVSKDGGKPGNDAFSYRVEHTITIDEQETASNFLLQNLSYNDYLVVLEIAQDDAVLYQSKYIAPGQYLDSVALKNTANPDKPATAYIYLVDPDTLELVETFEEPITILKIKNKV